MQKKGDNIAEDVEIMYRLSKTELNNTHIINYLFKSTLTKTYYLASIVGKKSYGVEII